MTRSLALPRHSTVQIQQCDARSCSSRTASTQRVATRRLPLSLGSLLRVFRCMRSASAKISIALSCKRWRKRAPAVRRTSPGQRRRVLALIRDAAVEPEEPTRATVLRRLARPLRGLGGPLLRILPARFLEQMRERLELAGAPISEAEFIGIRFASTAGFALALGLIGFRVRGGLESAAIGGVFGAAAGLSIPGFVLGSMARRRKNAIRKALVPTLDMLALSADAGLAFDGAIAQVVLRWKNPLSEELRRLLLEFQMGRDRRQALRELARRTDLPDVGR